MIFRLWHNPTITWTSLKLVRFQDFQVWVEILAVVAWPIRRHPGSTNQEASWVDQSGVRILWPMVRLNSLKTFLYWDCSLFDYRKYILMGNIFISCPWYRELIYSVSIYWLYNTVLFQILPKILMNNYSSYLPWMTCEIDYWERNFCSLKHRQNNVQPPFTMFASVYLLKHSYCWVTGGSCGWSGQCIVPRHPARSSVRVLPQAGPPTGTQTKQLFEEQEEQFWEAVCRIIIKLAILELRSHSLKYNTVQAHFFLINEI